MRRFVDSVVDNAKTAAEVVDLNARLSSEMRDILGMLGEIEVISKQTNLLNTAIEAACGFAVVADDVRDLSGSSPVRLERLSSGEIELF